MLNAAAINALVGLGSAVASASVAHFVYRKRDKADYEAKLMNALSDLSGKYVELNRKMVEMSDKIMCMETENIQLKAQIIILKKCACNE